MDLTHVAYTRDPSGAARIYINAQQTAKRQIGGDLSNWDSTYRLTLANEMIGGRPWLGTFRLVAIYQRALTPEEIQENYQAGVGQ
jgi:hypothetical protein